MSLIYIVEDDDSIREIEAIALKNSNYIVRSFGCAADFFKKTAEILPDLVLLDIMLPDENGYEIIRKLRKDPKTAEIPVIMVTAKTSEMDLVRGLDNGADDYIRKPFSILELLSRVKALLRRSTKETASFFSCGGIELDHISFRYSDDMPFILRDLSLKIRPGEYVAIVGKTGCGKSTLMRLLLGFEKPQKGAVYFDGKDLERLDKASLRKKIGTVTQDAGLFQGDIYSNIVITDPSLTVEQAWEAAETAGIADDIRAMPMGMYTIIAEGQGGISGGQRQRIMIARAVAPKPKLLMFDEATSALDNRTQRQVSEALDGMGCTRIVIAHRLSTIRHCDRILVLDGGRIVEDGTYDELIEKGGLFAELVERQRLDTAG